MNALYGRFYDRSVVRDAVLGLNVLLLREGDGLVGHADPFQDLDINIG